MYGVLLPCTDSPPPPPPSQLTTWTSQILSYAVTTFINAFLANLNPSASRASLRKLLTALATAFDFALVAGTGILACTHPAFIPALLALQAWLVLLSLVLLTALPVAPERLPPPPAAAGVRRLLAPTRLRAGALLLTGVAILAVDFNAFPRRFAKTETFGTGLMDVGVGVFVVVNALVSPLARSGFTTTNNNDNNHKHAAGDSNNSSSFRSRLALGLISAVKSAGLLSVLGFARIAGNSSVNYQVHTSEYGVHWNFFFTLAVVLGVAALLHALLPALSSVQFDAALYCQEVELSCNDTACQSAKALGCAVKRVLTQALSHPRAWVCALLGLTITAGHQYWLVYPLRLSSSSLSNPFDGTDWVFNAPRVGLLTANKEGIASLPGYIAILLLSVPIGRILYAAAALNNCSQQRTSAKTNALAATIIIGSFSALAWLATSVLVHTTQDVSRRLANSAFVAWQIALATLMLTVALAVEAADVPGWIQSKLGSRNDAASRGFRENTVSMAEAGGAGLGATVNAIDSAPLSFFLITNLLTGAVNLAIDTMNTSDSTAIAVLVCYIALSVIAVTFVTPTAIAFVKRRVKRQVPKKQD